MRKYVVAGCAAALLLAIVLLHGGHRMSAVGGGTGFRSIPRDLFFGTRPPKGETGTARAFAQVPGAVVCPNYKAVTDVVSLYNKAAEDEAEDQLSHGQSRLLRGPATAKPNLQAFGCILVAPGTQLILEAGNLVPVVSLSVHGAWIQGVTLPDMISRPFETAMLEPAGHTDDDSSSPTVSRLATPSFWLPAGAPAESTTGQIEFSTGHVVLAGHSFPLVTQHELNPAELAQAGQFLDLGSSSAAEGLWFRIAVPDSAPMLSGKSLCGPAEAVWMLAVISGDQRDALQLAFFSAQQVPDLAPPPLVGSGHLCGAFSYVPFSSREAALRATR